MYLQQNKGCLTELLQIHEKKKEKKTSAICQMLQLSDFYSKYTTTPAIAQKRVEHGSVIPLRWKLYYPRRVKHR